MVVNGSPIILITIFCIVYNLIKVLLSISYYIDVGNTMQLMCCMDNTAGSFALRENKHILQYIARFQCKNIWVTSTIFWSCQLHACCVCDMLQTSRDASNLMQSLNVVEKLLLFVNLGSAYRKPLFFDCIPTISTIKIRPRNSSRGGCIRSEKHQISPEMLIYRSSARRS